MQELEQENKKEKKEQLIDLIAFRKQEIEYAILAAKNEQENKELLLSEKQKPWYKRDLFFNLLGAGVTVIVIIALMLIAWLVSLYA
ncbi:hypothetical protein [Mycoplasma hafezii]|uniref:hypothetical protein n=1 Tax=Mycoplasma hafezii TaxID=525886 RepID=UPI003CF10686